MTSPTRSSPRLESIRRYRREILDAAARHGARNLRVFGSVARGDDDEGSDVDVVIDVEPGRTLLDVIAFEQDLQQLLGRKVEVPDGRRSESVPATADPCRSRLAVKDDRVYGASLERNKIYAVRADDDGDLRVVDESGEDYLFAADRFVAIDVPAAVKASLLKQA